MPINIRAKGANGERKIATDLNDIINGVILGRGGALPVKPIVQRNQNQSAVGGGDLTGTFGLSIEVKCQEALSVNTWWKQCVEASKRNGEQPVLLYKQNNKGIICVTMVEVWITPQKKHWVRASFSYDDFKVWFTELVTVKLSEGYIPRV